MTCLHCIIGNAAREAAPKTADGRPCGKAVLAALAAFAGDVLAGAEAETQRNALEFFNSEVSRRVAYLESRPGGAPLMPLSEVLH